MDFTLAIANFILGFYIKMMHVYRLYLFNKKIVIVESTCSIISIISVQKFIESLVITLFSSSSSENIQLKVSNNLKTFRKSHL